MSKELWSGVDEYLQTLRSPDAVLTGVLEASAQAGLPDIAVSPELGRLLTVMTRMAGARSVLEIGTLAGYSAICLARGLPEGGRVVTLEFDPRHAAVAQENLTMAGVDDRVEIIVGSAADTLADLATREKGRFDLVFIDADKESYPEYWELSVPLARPGAMIIADNVIRDGEVANARSDDPRVLGVRRYLELVAADPRVIDATVQTVGVKGHDGLSFAVVVGSSA